MAKFGGFVDDVAREGQTAALAGRAADQEWLRSL